MAHKLKFWYSDRHFESPPSPYGRGWCLNVDGKRYLYTASSEPGAEEPFEGAFKRFPDYRVVCVTFWSAIQEIAEADIPAIREQTIALRSELVTSQVESAKLEESRGEESAAESLEKVKADSTTDQIVGLGCLGIIAVFVLMLYYTFSDNPRAPQEIDSSGYISHKVQSIITAQSNWMVGESKDCTSYPPAAELYGKQAGYAFSYLKCDDGPIHNIPITFWGAEYQLGKKYAEWNCTRTSDSFVCKQTAAF